MNTNKLVQLRPLIERSWSIDTTWCPETYEGKDPAWGQCGNVALYFRSHGYPIMSSKAVLPDGSTTRHFWNVIHGVPYDLTSRQFPIGTVLLNSVEVQSRDVIVNDWFQERFSTFCAKLAGQ